MTDTQTITRAHVDAAEAVLRVTVDRFTTQTVEEAASFERKKERFVSVGQSRASTNGIGSRFDDMMEELGFPRRPNTFGFYVRGSMFESVGATRTNLSLASGQETYADANTMVVTPVFLSCTTADVEGLRCPCEAPQEPFSRAVESTYGVDRAVHALLHVTGSFCENGNCINRENGMRNSTVVSQLPAFDPTKPSFPFVPVG